MFASFGMASGMSRPIPVGHACNQIRDGYYKSTVDSHVIVYRLTFAGIDVVRILQGGMDFERHL